jgi:very-short-patch-repair endonuclease
VRSLLAEQDIMSNYFLTYNKSTVARARGLRRRSTDCERELWWYLRGNKLGAKFRRQSPIGPYIVDFLSMEAKLVIEADGGQHYSDEGAIADAKRDEYLQRQGLTVLRFSNKEIITNIEGILEMIDQHINADGHARK